jgi:CBS domain-containing protein
MAFVVSDAMVTIPKTRGPDVSLEEIRDLFDDDHVRMALIVDAAGRLLTTIERQDLIAAAELPSSTRIARLGTLVGRTVRPSTLLSAATATLLRERKRRLAVVDDRGRLLGLLCLKRDGTGFCSDEGIRRRAESNSHQVTLPAGCDAA